MPKRIKSRKKSKRKRQRQKKKNKGHLLSVVHGSWLKISVACHLSLYACSELPFVTVNYYQNTYKTWVLNYLFAKIVKQNSE